MSKFVVFGTMQDPHVQRVVDNLRDSGVDAVVADYFKPTLVDAEVNSLGDICLELDGKALHEPFLIWDRIKLFIGMSFYFEGDARAADTRAKEWRAYYHMVCKIFEDNVVNSLSARAIMVKPFQQMIATSVGLNCPPSLVTNSKQSLLNFLDKEPDIIMKSLSGKKVLPKYEEYPLPYNINTMVIDRKDVEKASDTSFNACPHFVQRQIHKSYELRIVVVNHKVHAFKIPSQVHEYYAVDWRRGNQTLDFSPIEIENSIENKLLAFMKKMGLFSGSIDMIVDKEGQYWFLECNQDGAWAWLDDIVNGEIAETFADEFKKKVEETTDSYKIRNIA